MIKKLIAVILCVITVFSLTSAYYATEQLLPFKDVKEGHWSYKAVRYVYESKIMVGVSDDIFGRDEKVTRAMFAVIIAKIARGEATDKSSSAFPDVKPNKYYTAAVNWVSANGIMVGDDLGNFRPDDPVTRQDAYLVIRKVGKYLGYDVSYEDGNQLLLFYDEWMTSKYARKALQWATDYGLASGYGGAIRPKDSITRAEMAAVIAKFAQYPSLTHIDPPVIHFVKFVNYDDTVLSQIYVKHGGKAVYRASVPVKPSEKEYVYSFSGWDKPLEPIEKDTTFKAQFTRKDRYYIVSYVNWDGKLLYKDSVKYNGTSKYKGAAPDRPQDEAYTYSFYGWDKPLSPITADTVITAKYEKNDRYYCATFVNWNGEVLFTENFKYRSTPVYHGAAPEKPDDNDYSYVFDGWDKALAPITKDITYTAKFKQTEKGRKIDPTKPMIALTYDDGPGVGTKTILDTLEKYNSAATFFELGQNVARNADVIKREAALGCEVASHSYSHPNMRNLSDAEIRSEIDKTNNAFRSVLGYAPELMRPPYGATNDHINKVINMKIILWSVDTLDWKYRDADYVYNYVMEHAYDGAIILMHSIHATTAAASTRIIPALIAKGYQLVTVSELAKYKGYQMVNGGRYTSFPNK
ncbi:MAG: polysaccharide deacetylase family protein [Clostridia bacterium]|nr:polysaccharide deacetylase family protein [Clostridia bacterium]